MCEDGIGLLSLYILIHVGSSSHSTSSLTQTPPAR